MQRLISLVLDLAERGQVPDIAIRRGIRHLLKQRLAEIQPGDAQSTALNETQFIEQMRGAPIALVPEKANDRHRAHALFQTGMAASIFPILGPEYPGVELRYAWPFDLQLIAKT